MISTRIDRFTDKGPRQNNEDCIGILRSVDGIPSFEIETDGRTERVSSQLLCPSDNIVCAVADGIGGDEAGEVASYWAVHDGVIALAESLLADGDAPSIFGQTYAKAGAGVRSNAPEKAGTTLTMASIRSGELLIGNMGDSRGYVLLSGKLILRTKDHSFVQALVDAGAIGEEEARHHPRRNIITKALGQGDSVPDVYSAGVQWDMVLLCSDGVSGSFSDEELVELLCEGRTAKEIVMAALGRGGEDNASALIILKENSDLITRHQADSTV